MVKLFTLVFPAAENLALTGHFCHVMLVGAKAFMRFLSGRISQHHLHLYSIHDPTVEHWHGLISTLTERDRQDTFIQGEILDSVWHHFKFKGKITETQQHSTSFIIKDISSESHLFVCILHVSNFPPRNQMDLNERTKATRERQTEGEKNIWLHCICYPLI